MTQATTRCSPWTRFHPVPFPSLSRQLSGFSGFNEWVVAAFFNEMVHLPRNALRQLRAFDHQTHFAVQIERTGIKIEGADENPRRSSMNTLACSEELDAPKRAAADGLPDGVDCSAGFPARSSYSLTP